MITVTVAINGNVLVHRGAVNVSEEGLADDRVHTYKSDDGTVIKHRRDEGAVALAIKMLRRVREVR